MCELIVSVMQTFTCQCRQWRSDRRHLLKAVTSPAVSWKRQWSHLTWGSMRHVKDARLGLPAVES